MLASVTSSSLVHSQAASADQTLVESFCTTKPTTDCTRIIKPPLDDREYVSYVLDNGLRVLLCSDPSTSEAAGAMDVHVGACSDPVNVPGLAHFTEHMLFLGTKPYPQEDSFESFLATNGGSSNAFTDSEDTVYYFDMEAEADGRLLEGLSRFGSFFSSPLFTETATSRELNAIESENAKNLQTDSFRIFQIAKSRASQDHPFSKFFTGNKKTLLDDTVAKGINLRQELIQFYNKYYSANQMTLAVIAPQSIDTLKDMVKKAFSNVPNRQIDKPEQAWKGIAPYSDRSIIPSFKHMVQIVPVQDLRQVQISWPIIYKSDQDRADNQLSKPTSYVAHLLGHEGPLSLLSYLKQMGWATTLAAANEEELTDFEIMTVVVGLTTQGLTHIDDVIQSIYTYISLMRDKSIPRYVYDEVLQLDELRWRFSTKENPRQYITALVTAMQKYPPELYVAGPRRVALQGYDNSSAMLTDAARTSFSSNEQFEATKRQVNDLISQLTVDNAMVTALSKTFEGKTDRSEVWYGTNYRVSPIPEATLRKWQNCPPPERLKISYPKPNLFIPTEDGLRVKYPAKKVLSYKDRTFELRMEPIRAPTVIRDDGENGQWKVYYKEDDRFGQPKAFVILEILSSELYASAEKVALANLFELSISDKLGEYAYDGKA
jgi:insulysin